MAQLRGNVFQKVVETAAPAAGAESITTVPAGKYWRLASFYATLTTDATVATRIPVLIIDDGTNVLWRGLSATTGVAAGLSMAFGSGAHYGTYATQAGVSVAGFSLIDPDWFVLEPGWRIRTLTTAIVAGDQWGIARLVVQETDD